MSARLAFRLAAIGFAGLAILLATLQGGRRSPAAAPASLPRPTPVQTADPALRRCQTLGAAGAEDPACLKAWADERARFLGTNTPSRARGA